MKAREKGVGSLQTVPNSEWAAESRYLSDR
jgi:hypothetical protein